MSQDRRAGNSRAPLIAGVVMALALLSGVNYAMQRSTPVKAEEHEGEESETQNQTSPSPPPAATTGPQLVDLGESKTLGLPTAPKEVVIGWSMTPQVQADPDKVYKAVQMAQQTVEHTGGKVRIRVVNVDANPSVPAGVSVGGKITAPLQPDGSLDSEKVQRALADAIQQQ